MMSSSATMATAPKLTRPKRNLQRGELSQCHLNEEER